MWTEKDLEGSDLNLIEVLSRHLPGDPREPRKNLSQDSQWPYRESNRKTPIINRPTCSVILLLLMVYNRLPFWTWEVFNNKYRWCNRLVIQLLSGTCHVLEEKRKDWTRFGWEAARRLLEGKIHSACFGTSSEGTSYNPVRSATISHLI
jgi:hypothetical protein